MRKLVGVISLLFVFYVLAFSVSAEVTMPGKSGKNDRNDNNSVWAALMDLQSQIDSFFDVFMTREDHDADVEMLEARIAGLEGVIASMQEQIDNIDCDCSLPSDEVCNEADDDGDGLIDEDFDFASDPLNCGGCGIACAYYEECFLGACVNIEGCDVEICDGMDNDCDGMIDEDLNYQKSCGVGACGTVGEVYCDANGMLVDTCVPFEPTTEVCDAVDNDCDGEVDEDFAYVGPDGSIRYNGDSCGVGSCSGGVAYCSADGLSLVCSTAERATTEVCDYLDNDCDGLVDDDLFYTSPDGSNVSVYVYSPCGTGICSGGMTLCSADMLSLVCSTDYRIVDEVCGDGLDNDCDGSVDEDCVVDLCVPNPCDVPPESYCNGDTAYLYLPEGTCVQFENSYECNYPVDVMDCSVSGGICADGACLY